MAWAGSVKLPALLISRLWFNSRMSSCQVDGPGATPGSRTILRSSSFGSASQFPQAARQLAQSSPQNLTSVGQHHGGLPNRKSKIANHKFFLGSWQTSNALAL